MTPGEPPPGPLSRLDKPVQFLKGVGPRRAEFFRDMGILTARDLLYHVPRRYDDASTITPLAKVEVGREVTATGEVRNTGIVPTRTGLRIFQAVIRDETGTITCAWPGQPWVGRNLRIGDRILVTGRVRFFHGRQIQPREYTLLSRGPVDVGEGSGGEGSRRGAIFVIYPASEALPQWLFRQVMKRNLAWLLKQVGEEEYLTGDARRRRGLMNLADALGTLHHPSSLARVEDARRRLAFDELFFLQLLQARVRHRATRARRGIAFVRTNALIRPLHESLPFVLTGAQARVLKEIFGDMTADGRMNRMLQGDVGSGKTLVALFAMLLALEGGYQAALMAPTGILAEQHARRIREFLEDLPVSLELLVGAAVGRRREEARARLASGEARLVVGTHALIQEGVAFDSLGLVVVDEQHRFGVRQRMVLSEREPRPDVLVMSATPIPRSLAMAIHGDLDLSIIDELPPGRRPVVTRLAAPEEREDVFREVGRRLSRGRQAYLVYPLVEESEKVDLLAAETEFARLEKEGVFAGRTLALLHGRVPADGKDRIMRGFLAGEIDVLVATTVIEVGIDVPNATVMVVENAERFGLSQLHQLRGRIGRGDEGGLCVLISDPTAGAGDRLEVFARTTDGFRIATEDLRLRGQGDLFGAVQHGHGAGFRFVDFFKHKDLIQPAQMRARRLVDEDPDLALDRNVLLRVLLDRRYRERAKLFGIG